MTDLNTAIAKYKGFYQIDTKDEDGTKGKLWVNDNKDIPWWEHGKLPNFKGDANLYMALFEEMPRPALRKWGNRWYCMPDMDRSSKVQWVEYDADTIGTAICLAFCKLKGIEVVG
jgi:hypothetical protein